MIIDPGLAGWPKFWTTPLFLEPAKCLPAVECSSSMAMNQSLDKQSTSEYSLYKRVCNARILYPCLGYVHWDGIRISTSAHLPFQSPAPSTIWCIKIKKSHACTSAWSSNMRGSALLGILGGSRSVADAASSPSASQTHKVVPSYVGWGTFPNLSLVQFKCIWIN
jgi:hypothetical protein